MLCYVSDAPMPSGIHKLICKLKTVHIGLARRKRFKFFAFAQRFVDSRSIIILVPYFILLPDMKMMQTKLQYTIEEKVIERAYKKLALDALVIQQGRLAEQKSRILVLVIDVCQAIFCISWICIILITFSFIQLSIRMIFCKW